MGNKLSIKETKNSVGTFKSSKSISALLMNIYRLCLFIVIFSLFIVMKYLLSPKLSFLVYLLSQNDTT